MSESRKRINGREWVNTIIGFSVLVVMIIGLFQINEVKISLDEVKAKIGKFDTLYVANSTIGTFNETCSGFWRDEGGKMLICT